MIKLEQRRRWQTLLYPFMVRWNVKYRHLFLATPWWYLTIGRKMA